jgi:hypothetical protein
LARVANVAFSLQDIPLERLRKIREKIHGKPWRNDDEQVTFQAKKNSLLPPLFIKGDGKLQGQERIIPLSHKEIGARGE